MIGYLRGKILENTDGKLILAIGGEESAVGYSVQVPNNTAYLDFQPGRAVELFVYTQVREDALELYGFATRAEKELYVTLLSVNGIGPKAAIGILSKVGKDELIQAVLSGDKNMLTQIPGIGKKTAERVVLELADPLKKKVEAGLFGSVQSRAAASSSAKGVKAGLRSGGELAVIQDAKDALLGLGYRENDVNQLLNRVLEEFEAPPKRAEDLVRTALQRMS